MIYESVTALKYLKSLKDKSRPSSFAEFEKCQDRKDYITILFPDGDDDVANGKWLVQSSINKVEIALNISFAPILESTSEGVHQAI